SGCNKTKKGLISEDALMLQKYSSIKLPYRLVNPISLEPPIAPHIAAQKINKKYTANQLKNRISSLIKFKADLVLIEGAGGWQVPLNDDETLADFVVELHVPVILVVGIRLGCINHALLTQADMQRKNIFLAGWVANVIDQNMQVIDENISSLQNRINAPFLGTVPFLDCYDIEKNSSYTNVKRLL
ncbi:TPA: dethiobiotin synthase, partial [Legionella anisa]